MATIEQIQRKLERIDKEINYLSTHVVAIGFFAGEDSQLLEIVRANEYGAHIVPKKGKYLWIPSREAIKKYGKSVRPKDVEDDLKDKKGIHFFVPKNKRVAVVSDGSGNLTTYFYLVKQVDIPARPFIRKTFIDYQKKYERYIRVGINEIIYKDGTGRRLLSKLGRTAVSDIRETTRRMYKPGNAPVTIENKKGVNNPLVDTGLLQKKITYKIIPTGGI